MVPAIAFHITQIQKSTGQQTGSQQTGSQQTGSGLGVLIAQQTGSGLATDGVRQQTGSGLGVLIEQTETLEAHAIDCRV